MKAYLRLIKLLGIAALFLAITGCASQQVQQADKVHVVRATDLVDYGYDFKPISEYETFNKTAYFDGSFDVDYTFETPESEQNFPLYMAVMMSSHANGKDAVTSEGMEKIGGAIGAKLNELSYKPVKGAQTYGGTGSLQMIMYQGQPVGNEFRCRKGKRTYSITMTGFSYFDTAADWDEFAGKKIKAWLDTP